MAATWTATAIDREQSLGSFRAVPLTLSASGTYTTGGDAMDLGAAAGLTSVYMVLLDESTNGTNAAGAVYDYTNKKIKLFGGNTSGSAHAELSAATSLTSFVCRCIVFGV